MSVIRNLLVKVGADTSEFSTKMKNLSKDLKATGKSLSDAGSTLTKGLTVPIAGAVAGLTGLAKVAMDNADELQKQADVTGLTAERLQELQYAGNNLGVELSTITGAQAKLTKAMFAAKDGTGSQADAFKALGISVTDSNGNLKDAKQIMSEAFTSLNGVGNETERDALAMQLFGKSAMELNPLIKAGGDELNRLADEAKKNGAVMSNEAVAGLDSFGDTMENLKTSFLGSFGEAFAKLAPTIQGVIVPALQKLGEKVTAIVTAFSNLSPQMQGFTLGLIGTLAAVGPVMSIVGGLNLKIADFAKGVGNAKKALAEGGGLLSALKCIIGPAGLVLIAIAAVAAIAFLVIKNWSSIKEFFVNLWTGIVSFFTTIPAKIKEVGMNIITGLWNGISNKIEWVKAKIKGMGAGIISAIKGVFGIKSPSKVMADQVGKFIPAGIAVGITDNAGVIDSALNSLNLSANVADGGGYGMVSTNLYMDSVKIASGTSRAQYSKNKVRSRSLGIVPV